MTNSSKDLAAVSDVAKAFIRRFGRPDPLVANGLTFQDPLKQVLWDGLYSEIGAGWFLDRFAYLFGTGLDRLQPCLDCWTALEPRGSSDRMILGRNAYGALLVMQHQSPVDETVHLLDPVTGRYWSDPRIGLMNLFGAWLPSGLIPSFLDHGPYDEWLRQHGPLGDDEIVAPSPKRRTGKGLSFEDLQRHDIVEYHRAAAAVFAADGSSSKRGRGRTSRARR